MATANSSRRGRSRDRSSGSQIRTHPLAAVPAAEGVPGNAKNVLQREYRRLQQALAVLTCLREATEHEVDVDLADVAAVTCDLVDKALYELALAGLSGDADTDDG